MWNSRTGWTLSLLLLCLLMPGIVPAGETPPRPMEGMNLGIPYPDTALEHEKEGRVTYRADIDETGAVLAVTILSVSETGYGFAGQVVSAVRAWRFEPATLDGKPVAGTYEGAADFSIEIPRHAGRMYTLRSRELQSQVRSVLEETKFGFEELDEQNGIFITKWKSLLARELTGLEQATTDNGITLTRFQLYVFVSPFAEPGRLYVNSMVEGRKDGGKFRLYNYSRPQEWLYREVEKKIGQSGYGIPLSPEPRRKLAATLLGDQLADECREIPEYEPTLPLIGGLSDPARLETSYLKPIYPKDSKKNKQSGKVLVRAVVQEDGWLGNIGLLGATAEDSALRTSAAHTISYWRYRPSMKGRCGIAVYHTVNVEYRLR